MGGRGKEEVGRKGKEGRDKRGAERGGEGKVGREGGRGNGRKRRKERERRGKMKDAGEGRKRGESKDEEEERRKKGRARKKRRGGGEVLSASSSSCSPRSPQSDRPSRAIHHAGRCWPSLLYKLKPVTLKRWTKRREKNKSMLTRTKAAEGKTRLC